MDQADRYFLEQVFREKDMEIFKDKKKIDKVIDLLSQDWRNNMLRVDLQDEIVRWAQDDATLDNILTDVMANGALSYFEKISYMRQEVMARYERSLERLSAREPEIFTTILTMIGDDILWNAIAQDIVNLRIKSERGKNEAHTKPI